MINVRVHIFNGLEFMDENVFIDIILPAVPRRKDTLYLTEEQMNELEEKAKANIKKIWIYTDYFYGDCCISMDRIKEEDLKHFTFCDANSVKYVLFKANSDIVQIEISK
jgi:hypothetical protein